jgi:hypothetical protein
VVPEPDYESEEWKGWKMHLTDGRADEILAIKKEESPHPSQGINAVQEPARVSVKVEDEGVDGIY